MDPYVSISNVGLRGKMWLVNLFTQPLFIHYPLQWHVLISSSTTIEFDALTFYRSVRPNNMSEDQFGSKNSEWGKAVFKEKQE